MAVATVARVVRATVFIAVMALVLSITAVFVPQQARAEEQPVPEPMVGAVAPEVDADEETSLEDAPVQDAGDSPETGDDVRPPAGEDSHEDGEPDERGVEQPEQDQPLVTAVPTISGTAQVGQTLTVDPGPWTPETTFTYEWFADDTALVGATGSTLTLRNEQAGTRITVRVTGSKPAHTTVSETSAPTALVTGGTLTAATPSIAGTAQVGRILTANTGDWTAGTTFVYQWFAGGVAISGATGSTLTLTDAHRGKKITVTVTGTKNGYRTVAKTSAATGAVQGVFKTATPTISGTVRVGETLTVKTGTWSPTPVFAYQWFADGVAITGATKRTLVLAEAQRGKKITVKVTGSTSGYAAASVTSGATAVVQGVLKVATPKISGTVRVGQTLTANPGSWTSGTSFAYQWFANGVAISGATKSTLKLAEAQRGKKITVKVTGSKTGYRTASKTSAATTTVQGVLKTATPKISGTARVGKTLTAKAGSWTAGTRFAYRWYANGVAIPGATKSTLKLAEAQRGKKITVKVTGSKTGYHSASKTSAATAAVQGVLKTATPTISGSAKVGQTLTAKPGSWTAGTSFRYAWFANGVAISGATKSTLKLTAAHHGKRITVKVTGTKSGYLSATKTSAATSPVVKPLTAGTPVISGTPQVGSILTVYPGAWTSGTSFSYQWYANGVAIGGATSSSLVLASWHQGASISVKVTGTKPGYQSASRTSAGTSGVAGQPTSTPGLWDGSCPSWAPIKGNRNSGIYHVPGGRYYGVTKAEECFSNRWDAEAAGYRASKL